jgi:hypothetical protein
MNNDDEDWIESLKRSIAAIKTIIPTVLPKIINGTIKVIEKIPDSKNRDKDDVSVLLDIYSGVDYLRKDNNGIQSIASRAQFDGTFSSFTIREKRETGTKTEFEKRSVARKEGYEYPKFTLQAYFETKTIFNLINVAIIKTDTLYDFIEKYPELVDIKKSNNDFKIVYWRHIVEKFGTSVINIYVVRDVFERICHYNDRSISLEEYSMSLYKVKNISLLNPPF